MSKENEFIGFRSGQYEVVGDSGDRRRKGNIVYVVRCHNCGGSFKALKRELTRGTAKCDCIKGDFSEDVYYERIINKCARLGYTLLDTVGVFSGASTRVKLRCNKDGSVWEPALYNFLGTADSGCPECGTANRVARRNNARLDAIHEVLKQPRFAEGTTVTRLTDKSWSLHCPVCESDEVAQAGLGVGDFITSTTALLTGKKHLCRCHGTLRGLTASQAEVRVKSILEKEGSHLTFVGWVECYNGTYGSMQLFCKDHGVCDLPINNFMNHSRRCPACSYTGFNTSKGGTLYVLHIGKECNGFTGYGISNFISSRMGTHNTSLSKRSLAISKSVLFHNADGKIIRELESAISKAFPRNTQDVQGFKREATLYNLFDNVIDFAEEFLERKEAVMWQDCSVITNLK